MKTGKAGCGVGYAIRRSPGSSVGYCALSIRCGTRDEQGFPEGTAHFTEHTLFKGTLRKSSSVINSYLDRLGGELNAFTTKEEIVLHATVLKEDIGKASSLLFELATQPVFPEHEVELEKGVVIDEIASCKDTPSEEIYDRFESLLFASHPLHRLILGTPSSVKDISVDDLSNFVKERFTPSNMAFSVVADIDEDKLEADVIGIIDSFFQEKDYPVCGRAVSEVPSVHFEKTVNKRNHQANLVLGGLAPSLYDEKDRFTTVLLCNILGGPASNSILNSILRERKGLVYGVECSYTQYSEAGIVTISLGCDRDNLEKCLVAVNREIGRIKDSTMSDRRLQAAKKQLLGQLAISSDNGETQCLSMGKSLLSYGKVAPSSENREKIMAISSSEIQKMALRIFSQDHLSSLIYL